VETGATRTEPSAERRRPLSRERVLRAAFEGTDTDGSQSLSMRMLAQELGVEAMSLYRAVRNKGEIVDGMVDLVFGEIGLPSQAWIGRRPCASGRSRPARFLRATRGRSS